MADWFQHRLDAEEIASRRISATGYIHVIKHEKGGFLVLKTAQKSARGPIGEINLIDPTPASVTVKTLVGTIDCTPTWAATLPRLLVLLEEASSAEAQLHARDELKRMAALADLWVESQKREKAA